MGASRFTSTIRVEHHNARPNLRILIAVRPTGAASHFHDQTKETSQMNSVAEVA
jgi:hypothetical protein